MSKSQVKKIIPKQFKPNLLGENNMQKYNVSNLGKVLFICGVCACTYYFFFLLFDVNNLERDEYTTVSIINNLKTRNNYDINQEVLMPIVEISKWIDIKKEDHDIYNDNDLNQIDLKKLQTYFNITLVLQHSKKDSESYIHKNFRICNQNDFQSRFYHQNLEKSKYFLCPDTQDLFGVYNIRNKFEEKDRDSIIIQIIHCQGLNCKTKEQIDNLYQHILFSFFVLEESIDYLQQEKIGIKPVETSINLKEQFQLNYFQTRMLLYKTIPNEIRTKDSRWLFWRNYEKFSYLDTSKQLEYIAQKKQFSGQVSHDGKTYKNFQWECSFSMMFAIGESLKIHKRNLATYSDALSQFGGLSGGTFGFIAIICNVYLNIKFSKNIFALLNQFSYINDQIININQPLNTRYLITTYKLSIGLNYNVLIGDFIIKLYYPDQDPKKPKSCKKTSSQFQFTYFDKIHGIWWIRPILRVFKGQWIQRFIQDNSDFYLEMKKDVEEQMNLINIVTRIQKLSIIITVLINNPKYDEVKQLAEKEYLKSLDFVSQPLDVNFKNNLFDFIDNFGHDRKKYQNSLKLFSKMGSIKKLSLFNSQNGQNTFNDKIKEKNNIFQQQNNQNQNDQKQEPKYINSVEVNKPLIKMNTDQNKSVQFIRNSKRSLDILASNIAEIEIMSEQLNKNEEISNLNIASQNEIDQNLITNSKIQYNSLQESNMINIENEVTNKHNYLQKYQDKQIFIPNSTETYQDKSGSQT